MNRRGFFASLFALPALLRAPLAKALPVVAPAPIRMCWEDLPYFDTTFTFYKQEVFDLRDGSQFDAISAEMDAAVKRLRLQLAKEWAK